MMKSGIEELPAAILQEILTVGQLGAVDLASLEASASVFRAPSGDVGGLIKSMTEAAAHHYCEMHPVFESFPSSARLELLERCGRQWKRVLHFLECLERSSGRANAASSGKKVLTAAGDLHTLIVNEKGELFACGRGPCVFGEGRNDPAVIVEAPKLIPLPTTATRIAQISASYQHAAFVTETGQVYTFGLNKGGCCGIGMSFEEMQAVLTPTHVWELGNIPCHQVTTGESFTMAVTRLGEVFSWGYNLYGQLGHGDTLGKSRPQQIDQFDESDPVVQVSAGERHSLAVTKSGKLFSWGFGYHHSYQNRSQLRFDHKLDPKRVELGGCDDLHIVSAVAGENHSVAIDHRGRVYRWGHASYCYLGYVRACESAAARPREVDGHQFLFPVGVLRSQLCCAVQVAAARGSTFVLLDDGTVHCLVGAGPLDPWQGKSYTALGDRAHSIACGYDHAVFVTKRGAISGLGDNNFNQLGASSAVFITPSQIFAEVTTGSKRDAERNPVEWIEKNCGVVWSGTTRTPLMENIA